MHSVSDLTTSSHKTSGDVPPKLVGASTTVVGDQMYLFGGRLVTERKMVSDLYVINLETFVWQKIVPADGEDVPVARYFHSADAWNNHLVIFGGMGHKLESDTPDDLRVLNDIRFFDLSTRRWRRADSSPNPASASTSDAFTPRARYAHLSAITANRLFVIGGQDYNNSWLDDVCVYDLNTQKWVERRDYPRHSGTYRSVAVAGNLRVRYPNEENRRTSATLGPTGSRFKVTKSALAPDSTQFTSSDNLVHLPYSTEPTEEYPNDIYLYSNYNFTDVKRELAVFTPLPGNDFRMVDHSTEMTGAILPPGLRFPTSAICGPHLIFAGTYLAHSYQSFSIWALDLKTMVWTRLDPGSALSTGSWFKGCLWSQPGQSKFIIFGNKQGNLVEDYNRRLLSWDDVACIDLEAFGIYQPPRLELDLTSQELGLAALEEELLADFEVVCDDGRKIRCSRRTLELRWPWFRRQLKIFTDSATKAALEIPGASADVPLPPDPADEDVVDPVQQKPDPRLTPRSLMLSEPYPITMALLQYFYSLSLLTHLQHAPAVLSHLLLLSATYDLPHLQTLVKHAMHRALSVPTSVGVYEVATLCGCQSLQIRALKAVMSSSRRAGRARGDSNVSGGGSSGGGGSGSRRDHDSDRSSGPGGGARPRGMSDLRRLAPDRGGGTDTPSTIPEGAPTNGYHYGGRTNVIPPALTRVTQPSHHAGPSIDSLKTALRTVEEHLTSPGNPLNEDPAPASSPRHVSPVRTTTLRPDLTQASPRSSPTRISPTQELPRPGQPGQSGLQRQLSLSNFPKVPYGLPARPNVGQGSSKSLARVASEQHLSRFTSSGEPSPSPPSSSASSPIMPHRRQTISPPSTVVRPHPPRRVDTIQLPPPPSYEPGSATGPGPRRTIRPSTSTPSLKSSSARSSMSHKTSDSSFLATPEEADFPWIGSPPPMLTSIQERLAIEDSDDTSDSEMMYVSTRSLGPAGGKIPLRVGSGGGGARARPPPSIPIVRPDMLKNTQPSLHIHGLAPPTPRGSTTFTLQHPYASSSQLALTPEKEPEMTEPLPVYGWRSPHGNTSGNSTFTPLVTSPRRWNHEHHMGSVNSFDSDNSTIDGNRPRKEEKQMLEKLASQLKSKLTYSSSSSSLTSMRKTRERSQTMDSYMSPPPRF